MYEYIWLYIEVFEVREQLWGFAGGALKLCEYDDLAAEGVDQLYLEAW